MLCCKAVAIALIALAITNYFGAVYVYTLLDLVVVTDSGYLSFTCATAPVQMCVYGRVSSYAVRVHVLYIML